MVGCKFNDFKILRHITLSIDQMTVSVQLTVSHY